MITDTLVLPEIHGDDEIEGVCSHCGREGSVFADNQLCEDCDSDTIVCDVCGARESADDPCRHVHRTRYGEWIGAGCYPRDPEMRPRFLALLDYMDADFAANLRDAIRAQKFHTWFVGPLIGGGGYLELRGLCRGQAYADRLLELENWVADCDQDDVADGWHWLVSLYDDQTIAGNATTIEWIDEWLACWRDRIAARMRRCGEREQ